MWHVFCLVFLQLEQKQIPPPYRPRLESERDLANFPPEFTDEPVQLTPDDPYCFKFFCRFFVHFSFKTYFEFYLSLFSGIIAKIDQTEFDGFEYVNPLLMSAEDKV